MCQKPALLLANPVGQKAKVIIKPFPADFMKPSMLRTLAPGLIATLLWTSCNKEWIAQDENGARKWYDDHAKSLTPTQTEAVSLSYARLALKDGDVEMARKWAAEVVTPKMKTKIETEITKASGN